MLAGYVRISLPTEIADELVVEKLALRPILTRGSVAEAAKFVVEGINTGSAVVSIALASAALQRMVSSILKKRGSTDPGEVTISITMAGETSSIIVDRNSPTAHDETLDFLVSKLDVD